MAHNLAIIPARAGSKRIPHKNIKDFLGKPIIAYSIEAAIQSNLFDEIMVSTDDEITASIAQQYGARVPFFRSQQTANDYATLSDVVEEVINNYAEHGNTFDYICCILATAPLLNKNHIISAYQKLIQQSYDAVIPVIRFSYPIQRAFRLNNEKISMFYPENLRKRSQDLEPAYHDSGQFYWLRTTAFKEQKQFFMSNTGAIILSELEAQDIDTPEDWQIAEMKYLLLHGKKNII
ncbi:MAG: pseudaminic acid cytidylyltransferase [Bacteroidales bacterium]|nr:pseudaminic acid cytidylyltransferase [Bacteroidales bacterium]